MKHGVTGKPTFTRQCSGENCKDPWTKTGLLFADLRIGSHEPSLPSPSRGEMGIEDDELQSFCAWLPQAGDGHRASRAPFQLPTFHLLGVPARCPFSPFLFLGRVVRTCLGRKAVASALWTSGGIHRFSPPIVSRGSKISPSFLLAVGC